jgi:hypothetical protein
MPADSGQTIEPARRDTAIKVATNNNMPRSDSYSQFEDLWEIEIMPTFLCKKSP